MRITIFTALLLLTSALTAQVFEPYESQTRSASPSPNQNELEIGFALYYADYLHGQSTASGEIYRRDEYTASHKSLPMGTLVRVTRLDNGLSTVVRINDRGPYCNDCVIDVSGIAARDLNLLQAGRARVSLQVMGSSDQNPRPDTRAVPQAYDAPGQDLSARGGRPAAPPEEQVAILANEVKGYAIQLGSYTEFSNAERRVVALQREGFNQVYVYPQTREDGSTLNKVIIAPFVSAAEAQQFLERLRASYQMDGLVIRLAW